MISVKCPGCGRVTIFGRLARWLRITYRGGTLSVLPLAFVHECGRCGHRHYEVNGEAGDDQQVAARFLSIVADPVLLGTVLATAGVAAAVIDAVLVAA